MESSWGLGLGTRRQEERICGEGVGEHLSWSEVLMGRLVVGTLKQESRIYGSWSGERPKIAGENKQEKFPQ